MAIEKVRAFFRAKGLEDRIREFDVSSATVELAAQAVGVIPARIAAAGVSVPAFFSAVAVIFTSPVVGVIFFVFIVLRIVIVILA